MNIELSVSHFTNSADNRCQRGVSPTTKGPDTSRQSCDLRIEDHLGIIAEEYAQHASKAHPTTPEKAHILFQVPTV